MIVSLALCADHHIALRDHLYPGDGLEAAALLLCGRAASDDRHRLVVREVVPIPYDQCHRTRDLVTWSTDLLQDLLERAEALGLSVIKVHSHPQGYPEFSPIDDEGDNELLPTIRSWVEADIPHSSAVMLPGAACSGAIYGAAKNCSRLISSRLQDLHFNTGGMAIRAKTRASAPPRTKLSAMARRAKCGGCGLASLDGQGQAVLPENSSSVLVPEKS